MADGFEKADSANRTANLIRLGHVAEVDLSAGLARVEFEDGWISDGLPWMTGAAGALRVWSAPSVGEQVSVLSPSGEPAAGFILRGLFSTDFPAPADDADLTRAEWDDGAQDDYDATAHARRIHLPAGASFEILLGGVVALHVADDVISLKVGGTQLKISDGEILLDGELRLGGAGGKAVARHGDDVVANKIVASSTRVKAV